MVIDLLLDRFFEILNGGVEDKLKQVVNEVWSLEFKYLAKHGKIQRLHNSFGFFTTALWVFLSFL